MNDILSTSYFNPVLVFVLKHLSRFSAQHIILNSQASMTAWKQQKARSKNVHIIYPGTDVQDFSNSLTDKEKITNYRKKFSPNDKPLIGVFGRITEWKGQDIFLKAIANIPDINGVIVGDALFGENDYAQSLQDLTTKLNIENRVTFAGHLNDIAKAMAACDIIVHCSTLPEPFGKVIVEGSLTGKPIIATNAGGAKEIVINNETGLLTPPKDIKALTQAITDLINDPEQATTIADAGKKRAEEFFSTDKMIKKFTSILN